MSKTQDNILDEAIRDMLSMALRRYRKDGTSNYADYAYEVERLKQALQSLLKQAELRGKISEVYEYGYTPVTVSYPTYAKKRIAELEAGMENIK